jgi:hypothetical protein
MPAPTDDAHALTAPAPPAALAELIAYIRRCYEPSAPTRRLLAAYEAQAAELKRLREENAAMRQALALHNLELATKENECTT